MYGAVMVVDMAVTVKVSAHNMRKHLWRYVGPLNIMALAGANAVPVKTGEEGLASDAKLKQGFGAKTRPSFCNRMGGFHRSGNELDNISVSRSHLEKSVIGDASIRKHETEDVCHLRRPSIKEAFVDRILHLARRAKLGRNESEAVTPDSKLFGFGAHGADRPTQRTSNEGNVSRGVFPSEHGILIIRPGKASAQRRCSVSYSARMGTERTMCFRWIGFKCLSAMTAYLRYLAHNVTVPQSWN
jgi:hypothetical protein